MTFGLAFITLARIKEPWLIALIIGGVVAIFLTIWLVERARKKAIVEGLRSRGFEVAEQERPLDPVEDASLLGNPLLLYHKNKVRWSAVGAHNGNVVRLHEYAFTTGAGKSQQTHVFVFASAELPLDMPGFTIERKRWLMSHRPEIRGDAPLVPDPRMAGFACYALVPSSPAAVLTPGVCDELATWDKKYMLRCGDGWVSVGKRGSGKIAEIEDLLARFDRTFGAIVAGLSAA